MDTSPPVGERTTIRKMLLSFLATDAGEGLERCSVRCCRWVAHLDDLSDWFLYGNVTDWDRIVKEKDLFFFSLRSVR